MLQSSSSLVLDKILIPEDEDEKYQIRSPESAFIWNYKVSSTIRLAAFQASGGPEPWTYEPMNLWTYEPILFSLDLDRRETYC